MEEKVYLVGVSLLQIVTDGHESRTETGARSRNYGEMLLAFHLQNVFNYLSHIVQDPPAQGLVLSKKGWAFPHQ